MRRARSRNIGKVLMTLVGAAAAACGQRACGGLGGRPPVNPDDPVRLGRLASMTPTTGPGQGSHARGGGGR